MIDENLFPYRRVYYTSLGCKLNFAEMSSLGRQLEAAGFLPVRAGEQADLCVINTCSVTETADKKGRQAIHRLIRRFPNAYMVVTGCYAQLKPEEIAAIPGVDLVLGANEKMDLPAYLERAESGSAKSVLTTPIKDVNSFQPAFSKDDRTRYFLKVQDGCDYYCTYCTIPKARGRSRNGSIQSLVAQARQIAEEGGLEIVLSGVNIGDFGKTTGESFLDLLKALDEVESIKRFRISSVEPNLLTEDVIRFVASSKRFMPHFHIPLQAGDDTLLRLMHRRYDTSLFASRIAFIRQHLPHAFIGVDVIVGSRGETETLFESAFRFMESLDVTQFHVFPYSERPDTMALGIEHQVSQADKKVRHERVQNLSDAKWKTFYERHLGTDQVVLFEHAVKGSRMVGFTANYIRVEADYHPEWVNNLVPLRLGGFNEDGTALTAIT
jgi:threonylcarbamoyladenosine tRNA methylthiotransferase MtaB